MPVSTTENVSAAAGTGAGSKMAAALQARAWWRESSGAVSEVFRRPHQPACPCQRDSPGGLRPHHHLAHWIL